MDKSRKLGMTLQLDISKAYDKDRWSFLYEVLERIDFSGKIIGMIRNMVEIFNIFVHLNGTRWGSFGAGTGLSQGDLIFTHLLTMVAEVLEKSFSNRVSLGDTTRVKEATSLPLEFIQKFMYDTFLFGFFLTI